jgi:hypothetical protein
MRPLPAARVLTDLRAPRAASREAPPADGESGAQAAPIGGLHDKTAMQQRIEAAQAKGVAEGRAAACAEYEAKLEELRVQHATQLSLERCTWASREADRLADQLTAAMAEMKTRIADTVAELLAPVLNASIRRQAVGELAQTIETVLARETGLGLEIRGPEDLLALLRERLSAVNLALSFVPTNDPEVRVIAGQTVLETHCRAWAARIEEAIT